MLKLAYFLLFLSFSNIYALFAQDCDISRNLNVIEKNYNNGNFDISLDKVNLLLECDLISKNDSIHLYLWKYQLLRNSKKKKKISLPV